MTLHVQILWGSGILALSCLIHVGFLGLAVQVLSWRWRSLGARGLWRNIGLMLIGLGIILVSHTAQVWLWAMMLYDRTILTDWNTAIYFSLVTYTSLGYGDVVLGPGARIFGAFGAVTGLLSFGMSTAFLVSLMTRIWHIPQDLR